jgi:Transposase IS200 like
MRADHDLKEFNGERDHVHLLVIYAPKVRLSELVNSLKGVSCRRLKVGFPAISTLPCGVCEGARARYGARAISLVRSAAPLSRSFGPTSRSKGALNPRRERRGPPRYPVARAIPVTRRDHGTHQTASRLQNRSMNAATYRGWLSSMPWVAPAIESTWAWDVKPAREIAIVRATGLLAVPWTIRTGRSKDPS